MKILAVDSNSIMNRAFYGIKLLTTKKGEYTNAVYGYMNILLSIINEVKPDGIVCAFDLKAPTFRHKMYDGYKAQRKGMPEELALQMPVIKEILTCMGYKIVEIEGYEADDILGTFAKIATDTGNSCVIATGDRDSLQLVNENVNVNLATTKMGKSEHIFFDENAVFEKYGVYPKDLITVKALMGDTSDNIPGVKGIGEKTAVALVSKFKTLDNIYENIEDASIKKGVREKLLNDKDMAYLSEKLGRIFCEVPLDTNLEDYIPQKADNERLYEILARLEMHNMIKKLDLKETVQSEAKEETVSHAETVDVIYRDTENLSEISADSNEKIFAKFYFSKENALESMELLQNNTVYTVKVTDEKNVLDNLTKLNKNIICHSAKNLYRRYIHHNIDFEIVHFDTEIAAYIINSSSSDYIEENLFAENGCSCKLGNEKAEYLFNLKNLYEHFKVQMENQELNSLLYDIEMPLTKVLASMEDIGFQIDGQGLKEYGQEMEQSLNEITDKIYELAGEEFNINSPKQLGQILFEKMGLPCKKKTKTGYSTNAEVLEELEDKHEIVRYILQYRKIAKLNSTYVEGFLKLIDETGRIHSSFQQTETKTGRISSTEPNMQNIPVRTEMGANLRKYFVAKEGCVLVDADYSQIELRVLSHMAQDKNMMNAFINGEDIHLNTASQVFDVPPIFVTPLMRTRAKAVNFGIIYGMGAFSLAKDIGVSRAEADKYIKNYLGTFSGVKEFMDNAKSSALENGYVKTVYGRRRYIPEIKSTNHNIKSFGERAAMNMPIQGTAADIIKIAMVKVFDALAKSGLDADLILQVHDELIVECPEKNAQKVRELLKSEMENAVKLSVPMIADANTGKSWYEAK